MRQVQARTFRHCLGRSLTKAAVLFMVAAALLVPTAFAPHGTAPDAENLLTTTGACWSDSGSHPTPTRVVVEVNHRLVMRSGKAVRDAIEQSVFGVDHGLHVVEFCA